MDKGYGVVETAQYLGIKARTVREWIHNGKLNAQKLSGSKRWVITESEIRRVRGDKIENEA